MINYLTQLSVGDIINGKMLVYKIAPIKAINLNEAGAKYIVNVISMKKIYWGKVSDIDNYFARREDEHWISII